MYAGSGIAGCVAAPLSLACIMPHNRHGDSRVAVFVVVVVVVVVV